MTIDKFINELKKMSNFDKLVIYNLAKQELLTSFDEFYKEHKNENDELILINPNIDIVNAKNGKILKSKEHSIRYNKGKRCYDIVYESGHIVPMYDTEKYSTSMFKLSNVIDDYMIKNKRIEEEKRSMRKLHFENEDIIITDPCYVVNEHKKEIEAEFGGPMPKYEDFGITEEECHILPKDYSKETKKKFQDYDKAYNRWRKIENKYDDWDRTDFGQHYERVGIENFITRDTIYGDWSCTTFNSDTKEAIGRFCADAGLVSVFSLAEVRAYNPDIDKWIEKHDRCVTKIPNFTGDVWFDVIHTEGIYDEDRGYTNSKGEYYCWAKKGDKWKNDEVRVVGQGNINFITTQTGL